MKRNARKYPNLRHFDRNTQSDSGVCAVEKSVPPYHECRDSSASVGMTASRFAMTEILKWVSANSTGMLERGPLVTPVITTSAGALSNGTVGMPYSVTLTAPDSPAHWSVSSGTLPPGLTINNAGDISGTPTTAGTFNFDIIANNAYRDGVLHVSGLMQGAMLQVYNVLGTLVASPNPSEGGEFVLPLPGRGVYIVTDGKTTVKISN